ncbi:hypothetical protein CEXT_114551 [Caerostris extrusa]|uniref:Uncharacterized protein n=1 Tax=Caerostris extrusa TaxID=172846 RepID=A0AAV4X5M2_CAEEX|nr:hypothetical protein CEXT_114551 [Caerostris extrusa]
MLLKVELMAGSAQEDRPQPNWSGMGGGRNSFHRCDSRRLAGAAEPEAVVSWAWVGLRSVDVGLKSMADKIGFEYNVSPAGCASQPSSRPGRVGGAARQSWAQLGA